MDLKTKLSEMIELVRSNPDNQEHRLALIQYQCLCKWGTGFKTDWTISKTVSIPKTFNALSY